MARRLLQPDESHQGSQADPDACSAQLPRATISSITCCLFRSIGIGAGGPSRVLTRETGPNRLILDLCTGTADLALQLARSHSVIGCDFSHPMLRLALQKVDVRAILKRD